MGHRMRIGGPDGPDSSLRESILRLADVVRSLETDEATSELALLHEVRLRLLELAEMAEPRKPIIRSEIVGLAGELLREVIRYYLRQLGYLP